MEDVATVFALFPLLLKRLVSILNISSADALFLLPSQREFRE